MEFILEVVQISAAAVHVLRPLPPTCSVDGEQQVALFFAFACEAYTDQLCSLGGGWGLHLYFHSLLP